MDRFAFARWINEGKPFEIVAALSENITMTAEQKNLWLTALRSDEYMRGQGTLFSAEFVNGYYDCYCCLGVLEQVIGGGCEDQSLPSLDWLDKHKIGFGVQKEDASLGIDCYFTFVIPKELLVDTEVLYAQTSVATLNDSGVEFKAMADLLERLIVVKD